MSTNKDKLQIIRAYNRSRCIYEADINKLISLLISDGLNSDNPLGWVLESKSCASRVLNRGETTDEEIEIKYILQPNGTLIKKIEEIEERYGKEGRNYRINSNRTEECSLYEVIGEMDFSVHFERSLGEGSYEISNLFKDAEFYFLNSENEPLVNQIHNKKGEGLYLYLKKITDKCEEYRKKIEPLKKEIALKYDGKRSVIKQNRDEQMIEAKRWTNLRRQYADEYKVLKEKLLNTSSLLFWKIEKMRMRIEDLQEYLNALPDEEVIEKEYNNELMTLNLQEQRELGEVEKMIKKSFHLDVLG